MSSYYANSPAASFGGPITKAVRTLILINVGVFVLQLLGRAAGVSLLEPYFGLRPWSITHEFMIWQFVTYMFLHDSHQFFHIFINMFTLYMFGNDLERVWGARRFLRYYFITGIGAGLCSYLLGVNSVTVTIGASGAIYGLLLAYGMTYPNRIIYLIIFPLPAKAFVVIVGALALYSSITATAGGVAHATHLGGLLVGYLYLTWTGARMSSRLRSQWLRWRMARMRKKFGVHEGGRPGGPDRWVH